MRTGRALGVRARFGRCARSVAFVSLPTAMGLRDRSAEARGMTRGSEGVSLWASGK